MNRIFILLVVSLAVASGTAFPARAGIGVHEKMSWFQDAKFGLFVHWGLYSLPAGQWGRKTTYHEWFQLQTRMSNEQYEQFAASFNPQKFDAQQWAQVAKDAGMRYLVITAKHHEGFSMFDTAHSDYNIVKATPFKRDPMKDLSEACRDAGIRLGFFYALPDWHHPEMPARFNQHQFHGAPNPNADVSKYAEFCRNQVKELLTHYGPVSVLWFDGGAAFAAVNRREVIEADRMVEMIRELQPDCLINNRLGAGGDFATPERVTPGRGSGRPFEVCMTLNDYWGYNKNDHNWKSPRTVIRRLTDAASKGGNLLLNVGPTAEGIFPEPAVQILREVGEWMAANGESIYGTGAGPFFDLPWGSCTARTDAGGTTLYLHVFDWPEKGMLVLPGLKNTPQNAHLLTDKSKQPLRVSLSERGVGVQLPDEPLDPIASTVVLRIADVPLVEPEPIAQKPDGTIELPALKAVFHGKDVRYLEGRAIKTIAYWRNPEDWVEWVFAVTRPGRFIVSAEVGSRDGGAWQAEIGGRVLTNQIAPTGDYYQFETVELGTVELPAASRTTISIKPSAQNWNPVNLRAITLRPAGETASR